MNIGKKYLLHRKVKQILIVAVLTVAAILLWKFYLNIETARAYLNPLQSANQFVQQNLGQTLMLFDLGVVDVNHDRWLDIYTSNHGHRQSLLEGSNEGKFRDRLSQWQLAHSPQFPGLEAAVNLPQIEVPGLYIYWRHKTLVIQTHGLGSSSRLEGKMRVPRSGKILRQQNFEVAQDVSKVQKWQAGERPQPREKYLVAYQFVAGGDAQLEIQFPGSPTTQFQIEESFPLPRVYIGERGIHPPSSEFVLYLQDRHGMAWADYNGDSNLDVFIVNGGFGGKAKQVAPDARDELLVSDGSHFTDNTVQAGLIKDSCPGRQVSWVDFNRDGLLDIYAVCGRGRGASQLALNQLFQQQPDGKFIDVAVEKGLALPGEGKFVWIDGERDGDLDLFWSDSAGFWLYVNESGQFVGQFLGENAGGSSKLTVADCDADGDWDVFAASPGGNALLFNNKGNYQIIPPQAVGLPTKSITANWVDYDNDGLVDLHLLPDGIYRQRRDCHFEATRLLKLQVPREVHPAATWFDADNDGFRDLLMAVKYDNPTQSVRWWRQLSQGEKNPPPAERETWELQIERNLGSPHHWLEIVLVGSGQNPQAIGAEVAVVTAGGTQIQPVGQSEGSIFSQGHYRLYFGLGQNEQVKTLKITWPDGQRQEIQPPEIDQLIIIEQPNLL